MAVCDYTGGSLRGQRDPNVDEYARKEALRNNRRRPIEETLAEVGEGRRDVRVGTALTAVVGACDGELPVSVIMAAVASLLEVDAAALAGELLPELRELLVTGVLRFVG